MSMQFSMFGGNFATSALSTQVLDAAGEGIGVQFRASLTDSINRIYGYCSAVAGTSPVYEARIETIDANGLPTGTLVAGSAAQTFTPEDSTAFAITFSSPAALTAGTHYALVIQHSSGAIGGSDNATFNYTISSILDGSLAPTPVVNTGAGWGTSAALNISCLGVQYDSTTDKFVLGNCPCIDMAQEGVWSSASNPDERGALFTVPITIDIIGCTIPFRISGTTADFNVSLYSGDSSADTDLLERQSFDASFMTVFGWNGFSVEFNPAHTLSPGNNYRIALEATGAGDIRMRSGLFATQALKESVFGSPLAKTTRDGRGTWTNALAEMITIRPWFENAQAGGGGGGGRSYPRGVV